MHGLTSGSLPSFIAQVLRATCGKVVQQRAPPVVPRRGGSSKLLLREVGLLTAFQRWLATIAMFTCRAAARGLNAASHSLMCGHSLGMRGTFRQGNGVLGRLQTIAALLAK